LYTSSSTTSHLYTHAYSPTRAKKTSQRGRPRPSQVPELIGSCHGWITRRGTREAGWSLALGWADVEALHVSLLPLFLFSFFLFVVPLSRHLYLPPVYPSPLSIAFPTQLSYAETVFAATGALYCGAYTPLRSNQPAIPRFRQTPNLELEWFVSER
jgi:hypothetical protein